MLRKIRGPLCATYKDEEENRGPVSVMEQKGHAASAAPPPEPTEPTDSALTENCFWEAREPEGIVRVNPEPNSVLKNHPRLLMKKEAAEAFVPSQNVLRDGTGSKPHSMRHQEFEAGRVLSRAHNSQRVLSPTDFEMSEGDGISAAKAHLLASDLVTAYEQTVKAESTFQASFNNHVRTLVSRQETAVGLMHLYDFVCAYMEHPQSKALWAQLLLIAQHCRDHGLIREALLNIADPTNRWLADLIGLLQTIIVQEHELSVSEKVAAINYAIMQLSRFYARKVYRTVYAPIDREVKVNTFYMRVVLAILALADDLGVYRNAKLERVVSVSRQREASDFEFLEELQKAFNAHTEDPVESASPTMRGEGVGARSQALATKWDSREVPEFSVSFQSRNHGT